MYEVYVCVNVHVHANASVYVKIVNEHVHM